MGTLYFIYVCDKLCDLSCIIPLYAKLATCIGDFPPTLRLSRQTDDRKKTRRTDRVPDKLYYYYYDIYFVNLPEFFLLYSHFHDKMLLFLLHHYYVTLLTPQPLEIKE